MKKLTALFLAIILVIGAMATLTSCGKETVVGDWTGYVDIADELDLSELGDDIEIDLSDVPTVKVSLSLTEDGKAELVLDEESLGALGDALVEKMVDYSEDYIEKYAESLGMEMEEALEMFGYSTIDDFRADAKESMGDVDLTSSAEEDSFSGNYKVVENVIYFYESDEFDESTAEKVSYELKDGTLVTDLSTLMGDSNKTVTFTRLEK